MAGVDEAEADDVEVPVAPRHEPPRAETTRWLINWTGLVPVVAAVVAVLVVSQWFGGDEAPSATDVTDPVETTVPSAPGETTSTTRPTLPTTTSPATTTTTEVSEPTVVIRGQIGPCRFGDACLIAGFEISGFDEHPGTFLCIYPNSERERSFNDDVVDVACVTNDDGDTITIEVDGVRSKTISEDDLEGTSGG